MKAFLEEAADEFLAHVTTIEAALLLPDERSDLTRLGAYPLSVARNRRERCTKACTTSGAVAHGRKIEAIPLANALRRGSLLAKS